MQKYFGTDGIRGIYGKTLTPSLAFAVGNALTQIKNTPKVVIGSDTRKSADALLLGVSAGIVQGGGTVLNAGIIPTAGISHLTKKFSYDFGIIITASHNPPEHNGIKIFDSSGRKLSDSQELFLEDYINTSYTADTPGDFYDRKCLLREYISHLETSIQTSLHGIKICLDASNGASFKVAPKVFSDLGANVKKIACKANGKKINCNCGSLYITNLQKKVLAETADIGFAFDGDADRVIAVSKSGKIFDGDKILYILATHMKQNGELFANSVVGTSHTNSGIMLALNRNKINLIRTDIGDKYVIDAMEKMNLTLGGEQSGHIIIKTLAETGDGVLTALKICEIVKKTGKSLDELFDAVLIHQENANIPVNDKFKVINNEELNVLTTKIANKIAPAGRVLVRASGTEEKVRVMIEHPNQAEAKLYVEEIKNLIEKI